PAAPDLQLVNEEGQRYPVHLLGDELLDETAGERHEVIGRDRPGNSYAHGGTLGDGHTRPHCGPPQRRAPGSVATAVAGVQRPGVTARTAGRPLVERVAAGAGPGRVRVVDREALLLDCVDEVDGGAGEVRSAHLVGDHVHALEHGVDVAVDL